MKSFIHKNGYIAISTVLIISSVIITIALAVTVLTVGSAQSSLALIKGESALDFVEGCAEDGMLKSQASVGYTGGITTHPDGTCQITLSKNDIVWTMTVTSLDPKYKKTIQVIFNRTPAKITLQSEKEI